MLLAVDIGNTSIKFGVFDGETLKHRTSIPTDSGRLPETLGSLDKVSRAIICSVVPAGKIRTVAVINDRFGIDSHVVSHRDNLGLTVRHEPIDTLGTDRLINAFAAAARYGTPVIVCSFGTATTIDVVNEHMELLGGLIAPGMVTSAKALHLNTACLPEVEPGPADSVINHTTESSIRAGLFYSQIGLVEAAVSRARKETGGKAKVVATGGFARMIAEHCDVIDAIDDDLVLKGLQLLDGRLRS